MLRESLEERWVRQHNDRGFWAYLVNSSVCLLKLLELMITACFISVFDFSAHLKQQTCFPPWLWNKAASTWTLVLCCVMILSSLISSHYPFWSDLYPPLRGPVYSHFTSLDGSVPDLCESILRGQCALLAPSSALSWAAVGPSGPCAAAGLDQPARRPLFHAIRKGMMHLVCVCVCWRSSQRQNVSSAFKTMSSLMSCVCLPAGVWRTSAEGRNAS